MADFWVPRAFSANNMWRHNRGRSHLSPEYRAWIEECQWELKRQGAHSYGCYPHDYKLIITAKRNAKMDLDNIVKPINDLAQRTELVKNDRQCIFVQARWATNGDGVSVRIEPAGME